jgi:hypothetical protein
VNRASVRRGTFLALAISSLTGCFRYTPLQVDAVPEGENVRVYVNRSVVESIGEVRTSTEPILRGRVTRREPETLFIRIPIGVRQEGFHSAEIGQDVSIPMRDIIAIERRRLDRIGTGALVAGTAGAAAVVLFVIMEAFGERETEEVCEDCVELLSPIISIPIR